MPRKNKVTTAELVVEENGANSGAITENKPSEPSCSQCHAPFTWRDHAYGAAARNLCRTHDQQRQRAVLRGSYVMRQTKNGYEPAISSRMNRHERRAALRVGGIVSPPRQRLRYAA